MEGILMTYRTTLRSAVCLAALVAGNAATADVTAQQVWDDWKEQLSIYGPDTLIVGSEDLSGGTLVVRDLALTIVDADLTIVASMGDLTFTEQGDGSVTITMSDSYPVVLTDEAGVSVTILVAQSGVELNVSGTEEAMDYTFTADSYSVELAEIVDGDFTFTGDVRLTANGMSGTYASRIGEMRNLSYDMAIASVDLLVDIQVPGAMGEYVTLGGKINGINTDGEMAIPAGATMGVMGNPLSEGMMVAGRYTVDDSSYVFDVNADGDQFSGTFSAGGGSMTSAVSAESIAYTVKGNDISAMVVSGAAPFPIEIAMSEYGIEFEMPVGQTETPMPFGLGIDLVDLTISDMIWSLFDPANVLPRDPATIQIGLSGLARPLYDMFDPAQEEAMMNSDMPFELAEVALTRLNIALAGASITGEGAFTFDNDDMETFAPMPRPEGDVTVRINGLNRLMDNLVTMGLLPAEQLMAPRMMMGMFARSTGDDQLESTLQVTGDGQVLANGQRIR
jgi:hypothetical protein